MYLAFFVLNTFESFLAPTAAQAIIFTGGGLEILLVNTDWCNMFVEFESIL